MKLNHIKHYANLKQ